MAQQPPDSVLHLLGLNVSGDFGPLTMYKDKRRRVVWFNKAPPLEPPSPLQTTVRNKFRLVATYWRTLTAAQQQQYHIAARRASLIMHGYNLFTHFYTKNDDHTKTTIARQTGTILV